MFNKRGMQVHAQSSGYEANKMSAYSVNAKAKKVDPMNKKIHPNPKYEHIKSSLDTGSSITKYLQRIEENKRNYRYRKDENFKRMKLSTFVQLVLQIDDHNRENEIETPIDNGPDSYRPDTVDAEIQRIQGVAYTDRKAEGDAPITGRSTSRSTLQQVIKGVGEIDVDCPGPPSKQAAVLDECPYLLLDVRDSDAYKQCHLISASSYPIANLSKATNYETKDMLKYKNREGRIILIYDEDERIAHNAATTLLQRGYDNLFMLSGGLRVAYKMFPTGLITGTPNQNITDAKHPPKEIIMASQKVFTAEDIMNLCSTLDSALQDDSIGSRLSNASTASSRMSNASKMSKASQLGRPAFKC